MVDGLFLRHETFDAGATRYVHRRIGSGPPLLLVHGFPLSGFTWRRLLPLLTPHFDCIVPDLPGLGETTWTERTDFSWEGQARGLARLVEHLGLERYSILAQDTGGSFARVLARMHASRVDALTLLNTEMPGHRPPWIPLYQALMRVPMSTAAFAVLLRSQAFVRSGLAFGGCFADRALLAGEFHERFIAPMIRSPERMEGVRRYLRGLADWSVVDAFDQTARDLPMPVRLIWGADDPTFPVELARRMARTYPRGEIVEIPGAKLLVHEEKPAEVARAMGL